MPAIPPQRQNTEATEKFPGPPKRKNIEATEKFPLHSRVRFHHLKGNVDLNDQVGLVVPVGSSEGQEMTGTVRVRLESGRDVAVRPHNLELVEEPKSVGSSSSVTQQPVRKESVSTIKAAQKAAFLANLPAVAREGQPRVIPPRDFTVTKPIKPSLATSRPPTTPVVVMAKPKSPGKLSPVEGPPRAKPKPPGKLSPKLVSPVEVPPRTLPKPPSTPPRKAMPERPEMKPPSRRAPSPPDSKRRETS